MTRENAISSVTIKFYGCKISLFYSIFFSAALYIDMTLAREQFCKFACPYARFQTVMMDADSYNVTYDYKRGEPRRVKQTKSETALPVICAL